MPVQPTRTVIYEPDRIRGEHVRVVLVDTLAETTRDIMAYYEADPAKHPDVFLELQDLVAEELLDLGREVLHRHGLSPTRTVEGDS